MAETVYGGLVSAGGSAGQESAPRRQPAREPAARTYARALPVVPVRARGLTIEGADGRRYLDCVSGLGTLALGHNHPVVLEAVRKVLDSGAPLQALGLTTPVEDAFVTELTRTLPPGLAAHARVRFCGPAGTDPAATAVALVRAATGRSRVVVLTDAGPGVPTEACCPAGSGEAPAGVILEPVRSEDGVFPARDAWMRDVRRITAERSVPLIADETETGLGRTGAFWAVEHGDVVPDVLVLSKAIGGSLPLAAVVHREDLHTGESGAGAFRGNQLALAAGAATLAHVREHRLAEHAAALGTRILTRLRALAGEFGCVGDVRGRGLMIGIELMAPDGAYGPSAPGTNTGRSTSTSPSMSTSPVARTAADVAAAVQRECLRRGLIVDLAGPSRNVVRLLPPLNVTEEQTSAVLDRLTDAVAAVDRNGGEHAPTRGARTDR